MSSLLARLKIALKTSNADAAALALLGGDESVEITDGRIVSLRPSSAGATTGVIFYQGGRCDPLAYLPLLKPLAAAGYPVFIPRMPLRLAVTGANKAAGIMAAYTGIRHWFIGGHSMGGSMAAAFASRHASQLAGLFMIGSYAAAMHAMPDTSLPVLLVHASLDAEVRASELSRQPERLPPHTRYVTIEGGDHYQFGHFAAETVHATISREEQQRQTVAALLDFFTDAIAES